MLTLSSICIGGVYKWIMFTQDMVDVVSCKSKEAINSCNWNKSETVACK